jgi:hypothetical protein
MTMNAPRAPELAALLDQHKDEITIAWTTMMQADPSRQAWPHGR